MNSSFTGSHDGIKRNQTHRTMRMLAHPHRTDRTAQNFFLYAASGQTRPWHRAVIDGNGEFSQKYSVYVPAPAQAESVIKAKVSLKP